MTGRVGTTLSVFYSWIKPLNDWTLRGKTIAELIEELRTFEDQEREVRISADGGETSLPISLVGKVGARHALIMNCEDVPSVIEHWQDHLPAGSDFPVPGTVYVAQQSLATLLLVHWRSPVTTDIPVTIAAGTRIRIDPDTQGRPSTVYALPIDYKAFERAAIPWWTRWRPDYGGYTLCVSARDLYRRFLPQAAVDD